MNIRLYNARILTMERNRAVFHGEIWIKNDKICYIVDNDNKEDENDKVVVKPNWELEIDCKNNLLMPGFKNAHTHSAMTFLRSFADDLPLQRWLNEMVFPMEEKLTEEDIYELTKLAILEYLSSGITSIFDMYLKPDVTARACMDMGMRCVLTSGLNDFTSSPEEMEEQYIKWNSKNPLISYQMGFHAEYTCSKDLLYKVSRLAHRYKAPVYTHLAETVKEVEECKKKYGMTPAVFLDTMGVFDFGGGCFHCVHMTAEDIEVFRRRILYAITNPASNLKLASGIAPIAEMDKKKIAVAIGTDGPASNNSLDMFKEMYLVSALSKVREGDASSLDAVRALRMATVHGAKAMHLNSADVLARGKYADLIMIDMNRPNMHPLNNIPKNLVYSGNNSNVLMTIVNGRVLYRNGEYFVGESAESIYHRCDAIAKRILQS